ncbi:MAG: adenosine-specific kinase [Methanomassiliicoccales archaeon]
MEIRSVVIDRPDDTNVIIGQTHFMKSAEDLYEALAGAVPDIEFGVAFCEASQERLVRREGNDEGLTGLAAENALNIAAGHVFVAIIRNAFPINVLNDIKGLPEVCTVFCATANQVEVLVAETSRGRGVIGVVDGQTPVGVENDRHVRDRKEFLRRIGYKL